MAQVTVRINGYAYTVGCQDGEEEHLQAMAGEVERRIEYDQGGGGTERRGAHAGDGVAADGGRSV